jgi:glucose/arabinose dehydrogenase
MATFAIDPCTIIIALKNMKTRLSTVFFLISLYVLLFPSAQIFSQDVIFERVYPGVSIANPVDLQHANDGSGRIFVVRQTGIIFVLGSDQSLTSAPVFLNIKSRVRSGGERGLLGLAFHPDFAVNGYFYVYYTAAQTNQTRSVISRFSVMADNPDQADPGSELVLLEFEQPHNKNNGGQLAFGPDDGYLYIASGDGGITGDPDNNSQNLANLLGAILRIDVDNTTDTQNYAIPADNPFAGNADGYREEIYAWGLRNPRRMSFDPATGWLWVADVGEEIAEEINIIKKGGNYGWNSVQGSQCYNPSADCEPADFITPLLEYSLDSETGQYVTGGYVYRGSDYPELNGKYFYTDYRTGSMWMLDSDGVSDPVNTQIPDARFPVMSFGTDENEELYALDYSNGGIYRMKIGEALSLPSSPVLVSPEDAGSSFPLDVHFSWHLAENTQYYTFQLSSTSDFLETDVLLDKPMLNDTTTVISGLDYATTYYWRVMAANPGGVSEWSDVWSFTTAMLTSLDRDHYGIPADFVLGQNYPNPFNPSTSIRIGVSSDAGHVKLEIFDLLGRKVVTLADREMAPGWHVVTFDAEKLNSGIYIYRLEAGSNSQVRKMLLLK